MARLPADPLAICAIMLALGTSAAGRATLLKEGFDQAAATLPAGWRVVAGTWRVEEGALVADSLQAEAFITAGKPAPEPSIVEPSPTTPLWIWVVIGSGTFLIIVILILVFKARRV